MTIGLLLDVDNTLTQGFIQQRYAALIKVEANYLTIEKQYESNEVTSGRFSEQRINLFNRTEFNDEFAKDKFAKIALKDFADHCLRQICFVSAGPNYYVQRRSEKCRSHPNSFSVQSTNLTMQADL